MDSTKGCSHKKTTGCIWCYECGAKRAGPKPKKTFEVGWYAIADNMEYPGCVGSVRMVLLGLAVQDQRWSEEVVIVNGSETWTGPAENITRLVAAPKRK